MVYKWNLVVKKVLLLGTICHSQMEHLLKIKGLT